MFYFKIIIIALSFLFGIKPHAMDFSASEIKRVELRAEGTYSEVYEGIFTANPNKRIAIKVFRLKNLPSRLDSEFLPYRNLKKNPHVVECLGIIREHGNFAMLMELMPFSLEDFYTRYTLSWKNIYNFGEQIARGLNYLHSQGVGHTNLKSNNVFVASHQDFFIVKIADFGLSKLKLEVSSTTPGITLAEMNWRSPESLSREYARNRDVLELQKPSDMYSYGYVLWAMAVRHKPFQNYSQPEIVMLKSKNAKEEIDWAWPQHFIVLLNSLWNVLPANRPTAEQVLLTFLAPSFEINEARLAPVVNFSSIHTVVFLVGGRKELISGEFVKNCTCLTKAFQEKRTDLPLFPAEVPLEVLRQLEAMDSLSLEELTRELQHLCKTDELAPILNAADILQHQLIFELGCRIVTAHLHECLAEEPIIPSAKLIQEDEQGQIEFEQLILAAVRAKDAEEALAIKRYIGDRP